ncbi:alpha/beta hydrolase [Klebsiella pneumoniae]|uniref:alpha/beta fold hydrolase n=1 Tax=Klebsiella pneumoniae TaxID=573 RepID=UPI001BAC9B38|nr:alpha/beta hydrolase [Klebsiella pneumoniae]MBQ5265165.1 alpha/beta hydrolase [Klebsiella pneumoniae]
MTYLIKHQSFFAEVNGVRLHYVRAGEATKEPILFVHGWPETHQAWANLSTHFADHDLIIPDLRGLGQSSIPDEGYDKKTIAEDLVKLVCDHLKLPALYVVGHDWGGVVAFYVAAQLADKCLGMAMLDVTIPGSPSVNFSQSGKRWHHNFNQSDNLAEILINGNERAYFQWFFDNFTYNHSAMQNVDIEHYIESYSLAERWKASLKYYRSIPVDLENAQAQLKEPKLNCPVLGLGGNEAFGRRNEPVISLTDFAHDVQGGVIEQCGHWLPEEQPELVAKWLKTFFAYCRPKKDC